MTEQLLNGNLENIPTVLGEVNINELGNTLIHEHLFVKPSDLPEHYDYTFDDVEKIIEEIKYFKNAGGNSILELTPINYGRNPIALEYIAKKTGINIMFITGFHKEEFLPKWIEEKSDEEIYNFLLNEINSGVSSHMLFPAAIKIGTSYNKITELEKRIISIVSSIHNETGIPIITHCDNGTMGLEQIKLFEENNVPINNICLSHIDLSMDEGYILEICKSGAYISFDHVGRDLENKDKSKINLLENLIEDGVLSNICLSGDMGRKKYMRSYQGKPGLDYIFNGFKKEFTKKIDDGIFLQMVSENPKRFLNWRR